MPTYQTPNKYTQPKYATIGQEVYSFGSTNLTTYPTGPAAPVTPVIAAVANANASITGTVFVQTAYVYPGSGPMQVGPSVLPMGFASAQSNVAVTTGNAVVVQSPEPSSDIANIAIGYNVFAGLSSTTANLVNTNAIVPIGTAYSITLPTQLGKATGGASTYYSSPTDTTQGEVVTANTAGQQFGIPISGSNFQGFKNLSWKVNYSNGTPSSANIVLQAAYVDNTNNYSNIDYTTNTAGDFRVVNPINAKFVRAFCATAPANTISTTVSFRIE